MDGGDACDREGVERQLPITVLGFFDFATATF